ncbi:DUF3341 domain-containing protein [Myxococcaceae bacterium GXIMD 01537]
MRRWVLGEWGSEEALREAARRLRAEGWRGLDGYSPFPVEGLDEALGLDAPSPLPVLTLAAGLGGAAFAFVTQAFTNAVDYPLIVGSRPLFSAPTNIPITFELGVLSAALTIFGSLLALFGFPRVAHPVFEVEAFRSASVDGFWLSVTVEGDEGEAKRAEEALRAAGAGLVQVVEEAP